MKSSYPLIIIQLDKIQLLMIFLNSIENSE